MSETFKLETYALHPIPWPVHPAGRYDRELGILCRDLKYHREGGILRVEMHFEMVGAQNREYMNRCPFFIEPILRCWPKSPVELFAKIQTYRLAKRRNIFIN